MKFNLFRNIQMFFKSIFFGLRGADEVISESANFGTGSQEIVHTKVTDNVMGDFLMQQETERVKETRDEYYRAFKESDKYEVTVTGMFNNEGEYNDGTEVKATAKRKNKNRFLKRIKIYNPEDYDIRVIQDNKFIQKHSNFDDYTFLLHPTEKEYIPLITIIRDGFIPRFEIENFANKIVVRSIDEKTCYVDLYTTMYASQFGKVDALFIAELNRIRENKLMRSDTTSFKELDFISDKAFNSDDLCLFKYDNIVFTDINIFDGNFVLTFKCNVVEDGSDVTAKYRTESLDKKLENNAPRDGVAPNVFAIERKINKEENK